MLYDRARSRALLPAMVLAAGCVLFAGTAQTANAQTVPFKINPAKSTFVINAGVGGLADEPRNMTTKDFSGQILFNKATMQPTSLQITVKADSFKSTDDMSAGDRQKVENAVKGPILESSKYPTMSFKSTKITGTRNAKNQFNGAVLGNLTLHGVTRPVRVPVTGSMMGNSLTAKGQFTINQTDYGIKQLSFLGGALKAKNPVKVSFNIVANR